MSRSIHAVALLALIAKLSSPDGYAQSPPTEFDVASVKPTASADGKSFLEAVPGRLLMTNLSVRRLMLLAYAVQDYQLAGDPPWMGSDHYDIQATAEGNNSVQQMEGPMLQALLAERFKMTLHRETRQLPIYEMKIARGGPKLQPTREGSCMPYSQNSPPPARTTGTNSPAYCGARGRVEGLSRTLEGKGISMAVLATNLSRTYNSSLGRNVMDATGLAGTFDIDLKWAIEPLSAGGVAPGSGQPPDTAGPSIFTALHEQLGLRLESAKGPVEVLVIDHIEKPL